MADYETLHVHLYVGYLDANNVSNFGGDPVTQIHFFKNVFVCVSEYVCPKTCRHIARRMMNG